MPDHLGTGRFAPFPVLAMAAAVTERVRLGTLVSNVPFYNLALFAREASSTAALLDGRLDLGLGAGHRKSEFDAAELPWQGAEQQIAYLEESVGYLRKHFEDEDQDSGSSPANRRAPSSSTTPTPWTNGCGTSARRPAATSSTTCSSSTSKSPTTARSAVPDARELLDAPQLLLGTVEEIAEQLETFAPLLNELQ